MNEDRQLWGIGGLSIVATLVVLLGASGAGADLTRAATAALGAGAPATTPTTAAVAPTTAKAQTGAEGDDASATTSADAASAAIAGASSDASATSDDAASDDTSTSSGEDDTASDGEGAPAATSPREPSNIKHVFVITLAGQGYDATFGTGSPATYLNGELRPKGVLLSGFSSLGGSAIADRIALVSGQPPNAATKAGCTTYSQVPPLTNPDKAGVITADGCVYPNTVVTVGEQLQGKRLTWKDYAEDLDKGPRGAAATCRRPSPDGPDDTVDPRPGDTYSTRSVPWAYFRASIDIANCDAGVVPLTNLTGDLAKPASTPNLTYLSPGSCSDGSHGACEGQPGGLAAADAFLKRVVPGILASPAYEADGLLVITFAGGPGDDASSRNGTLLLSKFLAGGSAVDKPYDPYSLLRTISEVFALPKDLAKSADATSLTDDVLAGAKPVLPGDD